MTHDDAPRISTRSCAAARLRQPAPVFVGHSAASRHVQSLILRAARSNNPILVSGPPGSGKRTVAEIIHHFSDSEASALPEAVIDDGSRLADLAKLTYVAPLELLSLDRQVELLAVVATRPLVLGTRLDPTDEQTRLHLHPELVARCMHVRLPTLRERIEDLEALALRIMWASPTPLPVAGISDFALDCLRAHAWPGNVTELEEVLTRAIASCTGEQIELRDLPPSLRLRAVQNVDFDAPDFQFSLAHAERTAVERAMRFARGNKRKAARLLQIGKSTLYRKLRLFDADDELVSD